MKKKLLFIKTPIKKTQLKYYFENNIVKVATLLKYN